MPKGTFDNPADYDAIAPGDDLELIIGDLREDVALSNRTRGTKALLKHTLSALDAEILKAGGRLPWIKTRL